jgi:Ca2+-binding RTX toxin-like protein
MVRDARAEPALLPVLPAPRESLQRDYQKESPMKFPRQFRPQCEALGDRTMPSITLSGGVLTVGGTAGADTIRVWSPSAGQLQVSVSSTGESRTFSLSQIGYLDIRCGGGNDFVSVRSDVTVDASVRGAAGNDIVNGGSGDDSILGGRGHDILRGRGGSDGVYGDYGNDLCDGGGGNDRCGGGSGSDDVRGGSGNDDLDGGSGRDSCSGGGGDDDIRNGFDRDTELIAVFTGGQGDAEFKFGPDDGGIEREFEVEVEDVAPGSTLGVFVDGVSVGTMTANAFGDARLEYELDFDGNDDGAVDFPPGFPEISVGDVVTITRSGSVIRQGTFVVNNDD